jgi:sterol desaturase/sphingolipid hydroxylase (fatty acid hydroxylase superfamily)
VINGAACHTMHHLYFNYNYGQFTTFWDRVGGTYQVPHGRGFISNDDGIEKQEFKKVD